MLTTKDTIAAIATPLGRGGIGIVRLSGPASRDIGAALFSSARAGFAGFASHVLHHGWIMTQDGRILDEVLVSFMPGPASYTGDDVLEINCHGGPAVVQTVLELVLDQGARLAGPGEFTLRAFLNGRMDLSQAEAVAEVVGAQTPVGLSLAETKLSGKLYDRVREMRTGLQDVAAQVTADLDFADDLPDDSFSRQTLQEGMEGVRGAVCSLLEAADRYACFREGGLVVLAGRVNAGKSSLLNALLGRNRAIVTAVPGTTRDYLEEGVNLQGVPVRLVDTAGLRQTEDEVERAGLERGEDLMLRADLVCLVFDRSQDLDGDVQETALRLGPDKVLAVANKQDLPPAPGSPEAWFTEHGFTCLPLEATSGRGVEELASAIRQAIVGQAPEPQGDELVPNLRQRGSLTKALEALDEAVRGVQEDIPSDMLLVPIQDAVKALGEITGEISTEDVLERIFSTFCIGK